MTSLDGLSHTDHDQPYSDDYMQTIVKSVKTIAMVGASPDKIKFSYEVLRALHETGYGSRSPSVPGFCEARSV